MKTTNSRSLVPTLEKKTTPKSNKRSKVNSQRGDRRLHLNKLAELKAAVLDKDFPITLNAQALLLARIDKIQQKLNSTYDSNEIKQEVTMLNQEVTNYRLQYAEEQKAKLESQVQEQPESKIKELKIKADSLEKYPVTFVKHRQKEKTSSWSFFKCLPCCSSKEEEPEKRPLLGISKR